jgi:hypothetical protein
MGECWKVIVIPSYFASCFLVTPLYLLSQVYHSSIPLYGHRVSFRDVVWLYPLYGLPYLRWDDTDHPQLLSHQLRVSRYYTSLYGLLLMFLVVYLYNRLDYQSEVVIPPTEIYLYNITVQPRATTNRPQMHIPITSIPPHLHLRYTVELV